MAITLLRRHTRQQPPLGARLERTHPLTQGLQHLWMGVGGQALPDLVTGGSAYYEANASNGVTPIGGGVVSTGTSGSGPGGGATAPGTRIPPLFTYEVWFVVTAFTSGATTVMGTEDNAYPVLIRLGDGGTPVLPNNQAQFVINNSKANGTHQLVAGVLSHAVATYDGITQRLYINGALDATLTATTAIPTGPIYMGFGTDAYAGTNYGGYRTLPGTIPLARLWNRALSAAEVAQLYTDPYAMFQASRLLSMVSATAIPTTVQDTGAGGLAPTPVSGYGVPSVDAGAGGAQATETTATTAAPLVSGAGTQTVTPLSGTSTAPQSAGAGTTTPTPATGQAAPTTEAGAGGLTDTASSGQTAPLTDAGAGGVTPAPTVGASPSSTDAGTGTTTSTPATGQSASALLPGAGGLVPTEASGQAAPISAAGAGDLHSATAGAQPVNAALAGQGSLAPAPTAGQQQAAPPSGAGTTTTAASTGQPVTPAPSGAASLTDAPLIARQEATTATGAGDLPVTPVGQTTLTPVAGQATDTGAGAATVTPTSGATGVTAAAGTGNDAASPLTGTTVGAPSSGAGSGVSTATVGQTVPTSTTETGAGGLTPSTTPVRTAPTVYRAAYVALLAGGTEGEGAVIPIPLPGQAPTDARILPTDSGVGVTIKILDMPLGVTPVVTVITHTLPASGAKTVLAPAFVGTSSLTGNTLTLTVGNGTATVGDVYVVDVRLSNATTAQPLGAFRLYLPCAAS